MTDDDAINDRAVERHDAREAANQVCPTCHGSGWRYRVDGERIDCPDCDGEGVAW